MQDHRRGEQAARTTVVAEEAALRLSVPCSGVARETREERCGREERWLEGAFRSSFC